MSPYTSRPSSRAQSRNGYHSQLDLSLNLQGPLYSPTHDNISPHHDELHDEDADESFDYTARISRINTVSTSSLVPEDPVESLTRMNDELSRKLQEAERNLALKLEASEQELVDMESKLEELRQELASKNREEKELRVKDVRFDPSC